jgi:hypothetical protein
MLSPCKRIFTKYKLLVVKMAKDSGHIEWHKIIWLKSETCEIL